MALTVSTPFKNSTVASVSGTTFNSVGAIFDAGDVGRCIRLDNGAGAQEIRKIITYNSTTQVVVDSAFSVGYFVPEGFAGTNPTAGDAFTVSHKLDDIDDGVNIVKSSNGNNFLFTSTVALNSTVFLFDENKQIDWKSDLVDLAATACIQFGSMHPNGYARNGCAIIDNGGAAIDGGFRVSGSSGDLHLYGCTITGVNANLFWRLYRGSAHVVRFVSCTFYGDIGMRLQGTKSILRGVKFIGNYSTIGPFGPIAPFGLISGVEIRACLRGARYVYNLGVGDIYGPRFSDLTNAAIETVAGASTGKVVGVYDYVKSELLPYPFINGDASSGSGVEWYQFIDTACVNAALAPVTDTLRRVINNVGGTTVSDTTTTSGSFARYSALVNTMVGLSTGNKAWAAGTISAPYVEAVSGYGWQTATLTLTLDTSSNVTFTMLPDTYISQANRTTVDAYTTIETLDKLYDRYASWYNTNLATPWPTFGVQRLTGSGTTLDGGNVNIVVDTTAASAFAVNTGSNTLTIKASVLSAGTKFTKLVTTGTISFVNGAEAGPVLIYKDSAGTSVPILNPNTIDGSRVQIYNVTDATEISNSVVSGGSGYVGRTTWSSDKTLRFRATYCVGTTCKSPVETTGTLTDTGTTFLIAQHDDVEYNTNGIDGSSVTEFSEDFPNIQIDISDGDGVTDVKRLYAWFHYVETTSSGIANWFGGMDADDTSNYRIFTAILDLTLDNTSGVPVIVGGGRLYRDDGATVIAATSGSIQMDPDKAYLAQSSDITAIKTKTDSLTFTVAGKVDANTKYVNDVEVVGTGTTLDPWNPA
jgi:hypothetical protein